MSAEKALNFRVLGEDADSAIMRLVEIREMMSKLNPKKDERALWWLGVRADLVYGEIIGLTDALEKLMKPDEPTDKSADVVLFPER